MERPDTPLRDRKRQRVREALVEAAHELFAERGYEKVTVADIAARAEVGRATFFRYFGDKQEVVFGGAEDLAPAVAAAEEAVPAGPVGDSLPAAMAYVRALVLAFTAELVAHPRQYLRHERLVDSSPELRARSLTKQRGHVDRVTELLLARGADPATAALAAELGMACFLAGRTAAGNSPRRLAAAVGAAFDRIG